MSRVEVDKSQPNKISTVFLDYIEPFLDLALRDKDNPTVEELNFIVRMPWIIWNAFYVEKNSNEIDYSQWISSLIQEAPNEIKSIIQCMITRRKNEFLIYDYMIGDYNFYTNKKTGELRFKAEARKSQKHENRSEEHTSELQSH